jgi:alpha-1,3-mannosyl-glycoprotein beta-1,2-N-acetylglucosaminyltransferase
MFVENKFEYVIVTEDDLDISPDFFSYFAWAKKVIEADPSLL